MTATVPPFRASSNVALSIASTRALPWTPEARTSCQPMKLRAFTPMFWSVMARRPEVTCSPDATTTSYSLGSESADASRHSWTRRSVSPAIAETTTRTSLPASASRRTRVATLRMRSMPAIDVPPNFITMRGTEAPWVDRRVLLGGEYGGNKRPSERDRAVRQAGRRLVGSQRCLRDAAQAEPGAPRLRPRLGRPALAGRRVQSPAAGREDGARRRLRCWTAGRAAGADGRDGHGDRSDARVDRRRA